jgi:N-acetylmuramoyl-L-alanine amidase
MFELMQNSYMDQSLQFASQVQKRFVGHLNREDRGVRQAAFWVLLKTACPSILFEMGFISNPEEEKFLNQDTSMDQMAHAIVNAFAAYTHRQAVKTSVVDSLAVQNRSDAGQSSEDNRESMEEPQTPKTPQTYFAVQVCASRTPLDPSDPKLKGIPCECRKIGDWYKYYAIIDTDRAKVAEKQKEIRKLFPDCWITKFEK